MTFPYMSEAMQAARQAEAAGEVPIGAVIIHKGQLLAASHNRVLTLKDPTAHAELLVIREACRLLDSERLKPRGPADAPTRT